MLIRRLALSLFTVGCLTAAVSGPPAFADGGKRVALVIGNAAYKESPLRNPVNDARVMAVTLKKLGFEVVARENATKQQMERAVAEFGQALASGTVALFYYAGHAMQVGGKNYLIPVDAQIAGERAIRLETLDVDLVLDQVAGAGSDVNLVILDACRNNPFERRFRSGQSGGLAQISAPKGTLIAYATAPGSVAADGSGANGLYTAKLVEAIETPGLPIEEVFKKVRGEVARATDDSQMPWEASSLVGTFYFAAPATVVVNPPIDREALHWQSVMNSGDAAQLQSYLDQYPAGAFAGLAKAKLATLQRPMPAPATPSPAAPIPPPALPGVGRFDGIYQGEYACGASEGPSALPEKARAPWQSGGFWVVVKQGRISVDRKWRWMELSHQPRGTDRLTGVVSDDGKVTAVGTGGVDGTNEAWTIRLTGTIVDAHMIGEGRHGDRRCTFDFIRAAVLDPSAGQTLRVTPAAMSPSVARFDGVYEGEYVCGASTDMNLTEKARVAWKTPDFRIVIKQGELSGGRQWRQLATNRRGFDNLTGMVADDGKLTISGIGTFEDNKDTYAMRFTGEIADGRLTGEGRHAARSCTLDFVRRGQLN